MIKLLVLAIALAAGGYALVCILAYVAQPSLVFAATRGLDTSPAAIGIEYRDVVLETSDGMAVHGWFVDGRAGPKHVLFLHGNAGNIGHRLGTLQILHTMGHAVLMIDYRGYGRSAGTPSESGTYRDARAAWVYLVEELGVAPADIVIYGRSLGGAVAVWLASSQRPGGLIIESTFTHLIDMARYHYPLLPATWLTRIHYDALSRIGDVQCPILAAHSPNDEVVPFHLGRTLAQAANAPLVFVNLDGAHNNSFIQAGAAYFERLDRFIASAGAD